MDRTTRIDRAIGQEIGATAPQVAAAVKLLDEGATVPFIARYRKEATGGLDDTQQGPASGLMCHVMCHRLGAPDRPCLQG
jgi:transcriptional accessory protein Tex/SPT6